MARAVYDASILQYMSIFDKITKAKLKDCIVLDESITFIVEQNEMGKAIGKQGSTARELESAFKKKIKIVEFSPELKSFINNLVTPLQIKDILEEDGIITIMPPDSKTRGLLIGRNASILRNYEAIIKRHFEIKELKVGKENGQ